MKKAIAIGLAAIYAAGAFAIAPTEASAGSGYYWQTGPGPHPNWGYPDSYYPYYPRHRHSGAYFSFGGSNFRFSFAVPVNPTYRYQRYAYANPHVSWCASHFRTYNPATNMYLARRGVWVACSVRNTY